MTLYNQDKIVTAHKVEIKPAFEERYKRLLGDEYDEFMRFSFTYMRKCIRVNTLKITVSELRQRLEEKGWVLTRIPWCKEGFYVEGHKVDHRFDIGNLVEHALGYFYIQESASMIPPVVLMGDSSDSSDESSFTVLDLCAAPGSKTTQLGQYMKNNGLLIANDVEINRLMPLTLNLTRMGITNMLITHNAFSRGKNNPRPRYPFEEPVFDRILVDAPCSGTGTIRKSFKVLSMYSYGLVRRMSSIQKQLIKHAFSMLKPGGVMVYSTCTQEPEENEGVINYLLNNFPEAELLDVTLDIKRHDAVLSFEGFDYNPEVKKCLRIYPQDNDTEGFFVAKIQKRQPRKIYK